MKKLKIVMINKLHRTLMFLTVLFLFGCVSTTKTKTNEISSVETAQVFGRSAGFFKSVLMPIGTKIDINIHAVDGKKVGGFWSYPTMVELSSGKHTLIAYCVGTHDGSLGFSSKQTLEIDVVAGKSYLLVPRFPTMDTCVLSLELKSNN